MGSWLILAKSVVVTAYFIVNRGEINHDCYCKICDDLLIYLPFSYRLGKAKSPPPTSSESEDDEPPAKQKLHNKGIQLRLCE